MYHDTRGKSRFNVFPWMENAQVNFSILYPNTIKAFHRHQKQEDFVLCVFGDIRVITKGKDLNEYFLSQGDSLRIGKNVWHGFQALGEKKAGVVYLCTNKYNPKKPDEERAKWDEFHTWGIERK